VQICDADLVQSHPQLVLTEMTPARCGRAPDIDDASEIGLLDEFSEIYPRKV
jgi:hypothetical protein